MKCLLSAGLLALTCLLLSLPGLLRATTRRYVLAASGLVFAFGVAILIDLKVLLPGLATVIARHDDWFAAGLVLVVGIAAAGLMIRTGWKPEELGLRLAFNPSTSEDVRRYLLPLLGAELLVLWGIIPGGIPSVEWQLFQLLGPGIVEELVFRGVLLALLDRAFTGRVRVLNAELGWGTVASSVVFGLCHGVRMEADWRVTAALSPMLIPMAGGLVLAWCRARSGSLLLPVLVHGGLNEAA